MPPSLYRQQDSDRLTFLVDLDNTLVECSQYYLAAAARFGEEAEQRLGVLAARATSVVSAIDLASLTGGDAWGRARFPRSFYAAAVALNAIVDTPDLSFPLAAHEIGSAVFWEPYVMYPGVKDALLKLHRHNVRLIIVTKGDLDVQRRKILINGLDRLVDAYEVVSHKDAQVYHNLIRKHRLREENVWIIGDSKDDILPAEALRLKSVLVGDEKSRWAAYEDTTLHPTAVVATFAEVPDAVEAHLTTFDATVCDA